MRAAGTRFEQQAWTALERAGLVLLARNYTSRYGEIDLIARDGNKLIFIEVKKSSTHYLASEHFTPAQQWRVRMMAEEFYGNGDWPGIEELQVDLALVDAMGRIEIVENALAA